jgi:hypothetical protein
MQLLELSRCCQLDRPPARNPTTVEQQRRIPAFEIFDHG